MEQKENKVLLFIKNNKIVVIIGVIVLIVLLITILFATKVIGTNYDKEMTNLVKDYYENNIKGNVIGIDKQKVTITDLKNADMNVSKLEKCNEDSYSYVIINNPMEAEKDKIEYSIENHLDCK